MKLHYQLHGSGSPLVILHGLFGTLENWGSQIKAFSEHFQVIAVDLRNHGRSPHADRMDYSVMAEDILALLDDLALDRINLLGHSMGGKVAMQLALNHPERIDKLLIVDIAPVAYEAHHNDVFKGLFAIDLVQLKSRSEADSLLAEHVSEPAVRSFLLKNLYRNDQNQFAWRMNLPALDHSYQQISQAPNGQPFEGPTLFIKGANSNYIQPSHKDAVLTFFPNAIYKVIQNAGHWPHAEKPAMFKTLVMSFFQELD